MSYRGLAVVFVATLTTQIAYADGLYYGGGVAFYQSESKGAPDSTLTSSDEYAAIGLTAGYRVDRPGMFLGAEADLDIAGSNDFIERGYECPNFVPSPYYCEHDATLRLRGVIGVPVGPLEGFASLGFAVMEGEAGSTPTSTDRGVNRGYTVGLGLQTEFGNGQVRLEMVYDELNHAVVNPGTGDPSFESLSAKLSFLFN